ncbi:MAG: class I SAM-dependent methyltransferase [Promethearchaeota archaeon]
MKERKKNIDDIAEWYDSPSGFTKEWPKLYQKLISFRYQAIKPYLKGKSILEIGFANGDMTQYLFRHFEVVIGLEGGQPFIEKIKKRFPEHYKSGQLKIIHTLVENFDSEDKYDVVLMSHVLEHLDNPVEILRKLKKFVKKDGVILILVPNANSLHRQVGVKMNILRRVDELNEQDKKLGHKRVYTWNILKKQIIKADLKILKFEGYFLKPLANSQIEKWFSEDLINAFYELGNEYQEISLEILAVCQK